MQKVIKFGFLPVKNDRIGGQNDIKGAKLYKSGHVINLIETEDNGQVTITCSVVAQTNISNVYNVKITLDNNRHVSHATCTCKAGLSGQCKHMCAAVHYVNSPESSTSKTSHSQGWGKPSHRQLLGYDKGAKMSSLFPPPSLCEKTNKLRPYELSTQSLGESLAGSPLFTMLKFEEKNTNEIIAAESLVEIVRMTEKKNFEEKAKKVTLEIFMLQFVNNLYNAETAIPKELFDFYEKNVCCDVENALIVSVGTIDQSKNSKWFQERKLRITASNAYKIKGTRFDADKVIGDLLSTKKVETSAMSYGKKNEEHALEEYKKLLNPGYEVVKVGLIICVPQPWLSCSPDGILVYGPNIWEKRLIEIKCPYTCRNVPVFDESSLKVNIKYVKMDENGLHLSKSHSIYVQVQLQMYVTNIGLCDLFIYSPKGSLLLTIGRDDVLLNKLVPQLQQFYFSHYLPKLFSTYSSM